VANLNKVMLIGRLTRDPEKIEARGEIVGAKFGFAVNNSKRKADGSGYEDVPVWLDVEIWNRGENKQGVRVLDSCRKGQQLYLEGHLRLDSWEDKDTKQKRSKIVIVVDNFQYLSPRDEGGAYEERPSAPRSQSRSVPATSTPRQGGSRSQQYSNGDYDDDYQAPQPTKGGRNQSSGGGGASGDEDDIPF
jgi:single-strand DNA-binding protein